jgi:ubiquinone/menaquinone biosynthesis C-methylase UbiE
MQGAVVERMEVAPESLFYHEHVARYRFAATHLRPGATLDIATGTGYGADLLRHCVGGDVVGVDIYQPALEAAQQQYGLDDRIHFVVGNGTALPFADGSFRNVVTLETIEHIEDDHALLYELSRVLCSDGTLVVSTPNRNHSVRHNKVNPYHVREYTLSELASLLHSYFADIQLCYQGFSPRYHDQVEIYAGSIQAQKKNLPAAVKFGIDHVYAHVKKLVPNDLTNLIIHMLLKLRYPQPDVADIVISSQPMEDPEVFIAICRQPRQR